MLFLLHFITVFAVAVAKPVPEAAIGIKDAAPVEKERTHPTPPTNYAPEDELYKRQHEEPYDFDEDPSDNL